jgi:hypothetical protein
VDNPNRIDFEKTGSKTEKASPSVVPTQRDIDNANFRQEIAEKQEREYVECLSLAIKVFGPGWEPSGRYFLLDKEDEDRCRKTGERSTPAATVYIVKNSPREKRYFTVGGDGRIVECADYKDGFGQKLDEFHPTMTIEVKGEIVHPYRNSVCWAPIELYHPKSADLLARLRESRERCIATISFPHQRQLHRPTWGTPTTITLPHLAPPGCGKT